VEENATIAEQKEVLSSLAKLRDGQAWFWCPSLDVIKCVQVRKRESFDSSAAPKPGQTYTTKKLTEIDLGLLKGKLAASIERSRQDDPKILKAKIVELEKQLKTKAAPALPPERVEVPIVLDEQTQELWEILGELSSVKDSLAVELSKVSPAQKPKILQAPVKTKPLLMARAPAKPPEPKVADGFTVTKTHQKILDALAWWEMVGVEMVERGALAVIAGYTVSGHFTNMLSELRSMGLITYGDNSTVGLTGYGQEQAAFPAAAGTLEELHAAWEKKISPSPWKILKVVIDNYPTQWSKEDLAEASGYTVSGHFTNMLSDLRGLGVISHRGPIEATKLLFPDALMETVDI
jgi:hypothetical protein